MVINYHGYVALIWLLHSPQEPQSCGGYQDKIAVEALILAKDLTECQGLALSNLHDRGVPSKH